MILYVNHTIHCLRASRIINSHNHKTKKNWNQNIRSFVQADIWHSTVLSFILFLTSYVFLWIFFKTPYCIFVQVNLILKSEFSTPGIAVVNWESWSYLAFPIIFIYFISVSSSLFLGINWHCLKMLCMCKC